MTTGSPRNVLHIDIKPLFVRFSLGKRHFYLTLGRLELYLQWRQSRLCVWRFSLALPMNLAAVHFTNQDPTSYHYGVFLDFYFLPRFPKAEGEKVYLYQRGWSWNVRNAR